MALIPIIPTVHRFPTAVFYFSWVYICGSGRRLGTDGTNDSDQVSPGYTDKAALLGGKSSTLQSDHILGSSRSCLHGAPQIKETRIIRRKEVGVSSLDHNK